MSYKPNKPKFKVTFQTILVNLLLVIKITFGVPEPSANSYWDHGQKSHEKVQLFTEC